MNNSNLKCILKRSPPITVNIANIWYFFSTTFGIFLDYLDLKHLFHHASTPIFLTRHLRISRCMAESISCCSWILFLFRKIKNKKNVRKVLSGSSPKTFIHVVLCQIRCWSSMQHFARKLLMVYQQPNSEGHAQPSEW